MIHGIGHDVVEIDRMNKILASRTGARFLQRILTAAEAALPGLNARPAEFAAGRFAAKEAISKAFGCGIGRQLGFGDIEILPDEWGKPHASISAQAWERLGMQGGRGISVHLSITHERSLASAFCIVEKEQA
ncbi:holo-ACP synthase [Paenibacillus caui]|uniref:holo-ACP synthase n=1 Tax=Paenibacillus caui TaxID=2873927 RepID=UPI001CA9EEBE|nr:holo-ACP synthase [Paenibacillus caui]